MPARAESGRRRRPRAVGVLALAALALGLAVPSTAPAAPGTGAISGLVTSAQTKEPIAGIEVCVEEVAAAAAAACTTTQQKGEYEVTGLSEGQYEVKFSVPAESGLNYLTTEAGPVSVVEATVTPEIDAALLPGGAIAGTVSSAATKAPLAEVRVCARGGEGGVERCASTAADGTYVVTSLAAASYVVHFEPSAADSSHEAQFYKEATSEAAAEAVAVTAGATTGEVDAALQGVPIALLKPAIVGRAIVGQTLAFLAGTWTNTPTSVTDEWGRCDATGAIESCHTIATTPTYTLTAEDVGHTIRIREQASNEYGGGSPQYLFSPPSAVVVVAPAQPAAPRAGAPAPSPGSGVLATTATAPPTSAQLKALLAQLLVPSGKDARVAALHKRRRYVFSFSSPIAGRLSIAWYLVPRGAHSSAARAKRVLVGAGKLTVKASGPAKLAIELTAAGRALLAKGKPLRLTAQGAFAPKGRPTLNLTRRFTLRR